MRTTVGFDFGTHQTKVCVERRDTGVVEYEFMTFKNSEGKESFFLPSMIQVCADNTLKYGFVDDSPIMEEKPKFGFDKPEPGWTETAQKPESPQLPPQPTPNRLNTVFEQAFYKLEVGKWEKECKKITEKYQKEVERWEQQKNAAYREYAREHAQWADEKDAAYLRYMADCKEWESRNGHLPQKLYRYFKQATFSFKKWENEIEPKLLSIWYMTYLFFEIEVYYGKRFALNMGVPTGKQDGERRKELAVSLVLSAYRLVDDVFRGDKNRFLKCTYTKLQSLTTIIPYSPVAKKKADILVFPEAVACLRPLLQGKKVDEGKMHTMIDIGGGTTDMSFFTVNNGRPHIFSFQSIPHGLNYLTKVDDDDDSGKVNPKHSYHEDWRYKEYGILKFGKDINDW